MPTIRRWANSEFSSPDTEALDRLEELVVRAASPSPSDFHFFQLKHALAYDVAAIIKDVYRDLLSANDKALASSNQQQESRRERYWRYSSSDDDKGAQKMPTFKGLLSIGVDEVSNSLIVSAPPYLMESITKIIQDLDQAAQPQEDVVTVVKLGPNTSAQQVEETLSSVLDPKSGKSRTPRTTRPTQPAKPARATQGKGQTGRGTQAGAGQAK